MKQVVSLLTAVLIVLTLFVSCGKGASISIYRIRTANEIQNIFIQNADVNSYKETVTYMNRDGSSRFSYELYYERAADIYAGYNVCESIAGYRLYAYEGAVYTDNGDGLCAVILLGGTYLEYINAYLTGAFPFDADTLDQQYSKSEGGKTVVEYQSALTPQRAASLAAYDMDESDKIISRYTIDSAGFIESIAYSVLDESGTYPIAVRTFERSEKKDALFAPVADLEYSVSVDIVYVGEEKEGRHFTVPAGIYVGIDTGNSDYSFYYDEDCKMLYSYQDGKITQDLVLYAKAGVPEK